MVIALLWIIPVALWVWVWSNELRRGSKEDALVFFFLGGGLGTFILSFLTFVVVMLGTNFSSAQHYEAPLIQQVTEGDAYLSDKDGEYYFSYENRDGDTVQDYVYDYDVIRHEGRPYAEVSVKRSSDWLVPFEWMKTEHVTHVVHIDSQYVED